MEILFSPELWRFLAGIAIFLYALETLEDIAKSAGPRFQKWIESMTDSKFKGFLLGTGLVNILQSSHAVSLILLALVGSGLMILSNAIAVVIGMNVGSVFLEALIGFFGLGIDIKPFVIPIVAIGGLGYILVPRFRNFFAILFCIGLVFVGLEYMKDSIKAVKPLISTYISMYSDLHRGYFIIIGLLATIATQSSSAVTIIVMATLFENILGLPQASAILMGAYIGSPTTALAVAFRGDDSLKKQVALSHFGFNVVTTIIFILMFGGVMYIIQDIWGFGTNAIRFGAIYKTSVNGLIVFFLLFKIVGGIIHIPWIDEIANILQKIIPNKNQNILNISKIDPHTPYPAQISILHQDILHFVQRNNELVYQRFMDYNTYDEDKYYAHKKLYEQLFGFIIKFPSAQAKLDIAQGVQRLNAVQESMQSLKYTKDSMKSIRKVYEIGGQYSIGYMGQTYSQIEKFYKYIQNNMTDMMPGFIDDIRNQDENDMHNFISGKELIDDGIPEIIQISDHIHGAMSAIHQAIVLSK